MGKWVKGMHHAALKCEDEAMFRRALDFYGRVLELELVRQWGEGESAGAMLNAGGVLMELFAAGRTADHTGTVNHFAFAVENVDGCIEAIRAEGYAITMEPKDIVIPSAVPFPARIAFCVGPVGEEIELFCEK